MTFRSLLFITLLFVSKAVAGSNIEVLGIGAPCMDIILDLDENFIKSLGVKGGSVQMDAAYVHEVLKKLETQKAEIKTGGSCANVLKGLANLGHSCALFGKIGQDDMGKKFLKEFAKLHIKSYCIPEKGSTQICACLVSKDGERTMRCCPGVANHISPKDLYGDIFSGTKWVHIEGYILNVPKKDYVSTAMSMAKESGAYVSFDLSSLELVRKHREEILYLLKNHVDLVFANKDEVKALLKMAPYEGCIKLQEMCTVAVVTMGRQGCLLGTRGRVYPVKPSPVKVVDTTGAGDLFAAGFLHGCITGQPLLRAATWGNLLGGAVCEVYGAEIPSKKWTDLKRKMDVR